MKLKVKVARCDKIPAFGAWADGSLKNGDGVILLNVEAVFGDLVDDKGKIVKCNRARVLVETLMHEFGHAVENALGIKYDDTMIENASSKYFK